MIKIFAALMTFSPDVVELVKSLVVAIQKDGSQHDVERAERTMFMEAWSHDMRRKKAEMRRRRIVHGGSR